MARPSFIQFQKLLKDADVAHSKLLPAVRAAMRRYRKGRLAAVADNEKALGVIFDGADEFAGRVRQKHERAQLVGGTPNESRLQKLRSSNKSPATWADAVAVYYYFEYDETDDVEFADEISAELFDKKTFTQRFESELRALRIDVPSTGDGLDSFHFGGITVRLTDAPDGRPLLIPASDREALFDGERLIPSEALKWNNLVSLLIGRDTESGAIKEWADDGQLDAKVHLLYGPGGVGKPVSPRAWRSGCLNGGLVSCPPMSTVPILPSPSVAAVWGHWSLSTTLKSARD